MGVVYLAYDRERDMEVAIKLCTYPQMSPLHIKREFRVAASLRHPNLVEFYDLIYHKHLAYFTMEYVDGISLRKHVSADPRDHSCLLYTSPSPRDGLLSRMPSSA